MRLSQEQISQFHFVLKSFWKLTPYKLYLYGSRTQDDLKGGDIDLVMITSDEGIKIFKKHELELLVQIKKQPAIGQRRIDFKAATESDLKTEPFLLAIADSLVEI